MIILRSIRSYSTTSTSEAAYIIGGMYTHEIIAQFKNCAWSRFGTFAKGRFAQRSISLENEVMVIGGYSGRFETEIWSLMSGNNTIVNPTLIDYMFGFSLNLVPFDFCTTKT